MYTILKNIICINRKIKIILLGDVKCKHRAVSFSLTIRFNRTL